eukprot:TRINITY_DN103000_c0_g1_i1.p1 TRINITY_DN103000_c0_g1~~TRINITY_DN103000_c0_g1_i1.p1  ORF type:complete len:1039 (+),score=288.00 TRINITY_DN103000_c0_g1_i1:258-3374(+)
MVDVSSIPDDCFKQLRMPGEDLENISREELNTFGEDGLTLLMRAVQARQPDVTRRLLQLGADPNLADDKGVTPMHMAAFDGDPAIIASLLAAGGKVNGRDRHGQTPLFFAPHKDVCSQLHAAKAEVHAMNLKGQTALHLAAFAGLEDTAHWIARHMEPWMLNMMDDNGYTAYYCASYSKSEAVTSLLKELGADPLILPKPGRYRPKRRRPEAVADQPVQPPACEPSSPSREAPAATRGLEGGAEVKAAPQPVQQPVQQPPAAPQEQMAPPVPTSPPRETQRPIALAPSTPPKALPDSPDVVLANTEVAEADEFLCISPKRSSDELPHLQEDASGMDEDVLAVLQEELGGDQPVASALNLGSTFEEEALTPAASPSALAESRPAAVVPFAAYYRQNLRKNPVEVYHASLYWKFRRPKKMAAVPEAEAAEPTEVTAAIPDAPALPPPLPDADKVDHAVEEKAKAAPVEAATPEPAPEPKAKEEESVAEAAWPSLAKLGVTSSAATGSRAVPQPVEAPPPGTVNVAIFLKEVDPKKLRSNGVLSKIEGLIKRTLAKQAGTFPGLVKVDLRAGTCEFVCSISRPQRPKAASVAPPETAAAERELARVTRQLQTTLRERTLIIGEVLTASLLSLDGIRAVCTGKISADMDSPTVFLPEPRTLGLPVKEDRNEFPLLPSVGHIPLRKTNARLSLFVEAAKIALQPPGDRNAYNLRGSVGTWLMRHPAEQDHEDPAPPPPVFRMAPSVGTWLPPPQEPEALDADELLPRQPFHLRPSVGTWVMLPPDEEELPKNSIFDGPKPFSMRASVATWIMPPPVEEEPLPEDPVRPFAKKPSVGTWLERPSDLEPVPPPKVWLSDFPHLPSVGTWCAKPPIKIEVKQVPIPFHYTPSVGSWLVKRRPPTTQEAQRAARSTLNKLQENIIDQKLASIVGKAKLEKENAAEAARARAQALLQKSEKDGSMEEWLETFAPPEFTVVEAFAASPDDPSQEVSFSFNIMNLDYRLMSDAQKENVKHYAAQRLAESVGIADPSRIQVMLSRGEKTPS